MNSRIILALIMLASLSVLAGCSQTTRYVTAEHWHNDSTFFIAYSEYEKTNYIVTSTGNATAHVMMCKAQADNSASCRPQVAVDRLLNPDEEIPDAPPPAAAPSEAPAAEAEPTAEPAP